MNGPYKKFPMLVYHAAQPDRKVESEEELARAKEEGFSEIPFKQTEEGRIKAQIEWHEEEIKVLKKQLTELKARKAA